MTILNNDKLCADLLNHAIAITIFYGDNWSNVGIYISKRLQNKKKRRRRLFF